MDCTTLDTRSPRGIWPSKTMGSSCSSRSIVGSWWNPLTWGSFGGCAGGRNIGVVPLTATSMMLHNLGVLGKGRSMEFRTKPGRGGRRRSVARHVLDGRTRIKNFSRLLLPWARLEPIPCILYIIRSEEYHLTHKVKTQCLCY